MKRVAERTAQHDSWVLERVLLPSLGRYELGKINDAVVRDLAADLRRSGYAPASINGIVSVLRKVLRDAVDRELLDAVPVRKFPREKEVLLRLELSDEERARFIGAFDDEEGSGVRSVNPGGSANLWSRSFSAAPVDSVAEEWRRESQRLLNSDVSGPPDPFFWLRLKRAYLSAISLRWSSVDLREGWIRVPRLKTKVEATIPISAACRKALLECEGRRVMSEQVFLTEGGRPYSVATINRYFYKAKQLAAITRRFRFHDLRHSFASLLASKGVSIQVIAKALGHSSSSMAERYARPNEEAMKSILSALDSASTGVPARATTPHGHRKKSNSFSNSPGKTGPV
jgi:site-specific recombinase XerC